MGIVGKDREGNVYRSLRCQVRINAYASKLIPIITLLLLHN